jgi:hypothetical protein
MEGPPREEVSRVPNREKRRLMYGVEVSPKRASQTAGGRGHHPAPLVTQDLGTK